MLAKIDEYLPGSRNPTLKVGGRLMRWHIHWFLFILAAVSPSWGAASTTFVASEDRAAFCQQLLKRLNHGEKPSDALGRIGARRATFSSGRIAFQAAPKASIVTEAVDIASFDVDNDGKDEILLKYLTSLRGEYGDLLWIIRHGAEERDFAKVPYFSWEEFSRLEAIESTTPWPYESRGLFLMEITPFSLSGINYFSLKDNLFGNPSFLDRTWVIAKLGGHALGQGGFGHETDDFETICSFKRRSIRH